MSNEKKEKVLNVPLDDRTRKALDARADQNGRAASREAASIIKSAVGARKGGGNGKA